MLKPITRESLSTQVFNQLRDNILSGRFSSGDRLPSERELCETLGVNRSSVREALKRLEQSRLIEIRQGEGSVVLDFSSHGGFELLAHLIMPGGELNVVALRSIIELRLIMGAESGRLAAMRARDEDLKRLEELAGQLESCPKEDEQAFRELDFEFHYTLARAGENLAIVFMMNSVRDIYRSMGEHFAPILEKARARPVVYREIIEAVRSRNEAKARDLCSAFMEAGNAAYWKQVEQWVQ